MGRKEYIDKLAHQLKELDDKIITMENNTEKIASDLKSEYNNQIVTINEKKENIKEKLKELNESNQEAFGVLKDGLANSFNELKAAIEGAVEKYKSNGNN